MSTTTRRLIFIIALSLLAGLIASPTSVPIKFELGSFKIDTVLTRPDLTFTLLGQTISIPSELKLGLDLQGGTHIVLEADMSQIDQVDRTTALESAKNVIARRVDLYGVSEPLIQTSVSQNSYRIIVDLPGVTDISTALDLIGQTAQLQFRQLAPEASQAAELSEFLPTGLSGQRLTRASVQYGQTGSPEVALIFDTEGATQFAEITAANVGKPLAIFLDDMYITAPVVNQAISGGQAVISGNFSLEEAKNLSIQLNAGALPVPIQVIEQKNIGATLGNESIRQSLLAGVVGLLMVIAFMILSYGWLGAIASLGLLIYALITLALYKLIPVTLTLPGLAGFVLSVGMAVDANILIFERLKEELRANRPWKTAMELGFGRAWESIKDANIATLTTALILFNPLNVAWLNTSGLVRGFALTLGLGIALSLFTGVVVSRTLIRALYRPTSQRRLNEL